MTKKNDAVSDFEWQSAAAFFRYVEVSAQLVSYSLSAVYSFSITKKTGFKGLVARKKALHRILSVNLSRLTGWAKSKGDDLSVHQLVFVRSLYKTTKELQVTLEEQIRRAEILLDHDEMTKMTDGNAEVNDDEVPF